MSGWIKVHRQLTDHWLWKDKPFTRAQAWIDILMECNHSKEKVLFGNQSFVCNRGEKLYSMETWGKRWGWNKSAVKRFLDILKRETMVVTKPNHYTTHLSVCKYDTYQGDMKRKRNTDETQVKPIKEIKNEKKIHSIIEFLNLKCGTSYRPNTLSTITHINARLADGFTVDDFFDVIKHKSKEWKNNDEMSGYLRPSTLFSQSKFEGYLQSSKIKENAKYDVNRYQ